MSCPHQQPLPSPCSLILTSSLPSTTITTSSSSSCSYNTHQLFTPSSPNLPPVSPSPSLTPSLSPAPPVLVDSQLLTISTSTITTTVLSSLPETDRSCSGQIIYPSSIVPPTLSILPSSVAATEGSPPSTPRSTLSSGHSFTQEGPIIPPVVSLEGACSGGMSQERLPAAAHNQLPAGSHIDNLSSPTDAMSIMADFCSSSPPPASTATSTPTDLMDNHNTRNHRQTCSPLGSSHPPNPQLDYLLSQHAQTSSCLPPPSPGVPLLSLPSYHRLIAQPPPQSLPSPHHEYHHRHLHHTASSHLLNCSIGSDQTNQLHLDTLNPETQERLLNYQTHSQQQQHHVLQQHHRRLMHNQHNQSQQNYNPISSSSPASFPEPLSAGGGGRGRRGGGSYVDYGEEDIDNYSNTTNFSAENSYLPPRSTSDRSTHIPSTISAATTSSSNLRFSSSTVSLSSSCSNPTVAYNSTPIATPNSTPTNLSRLSAASDSYSPSTSSSSSVSSSFSATSSFSSSCSSSSSSLSSPSSLPPSGSSASSLYSQSASCSTSPSASVSSSSPYSSFSASSFSSASSVCCCSCSSSSSSSCCSRSSAAPSSTAEVGLETSALLHVEHRSAEGQDSRSRSIPNSSSSSTMSSLPRSLKCCPITERQAVPVTTESTPQHACVVTSELITNSTTSDGGGNNVSVQSPVPVDDIKRYMTRPHDDRYVEVHKPTPPTIYASTNPSPPPLPTLIEGATRDLCLSEASSYPPHPLRGTVVSSALPLVASPVECLRVQCSVEESLVTAAATPSPVSAGEAGETVPMAAASVTSPCLSGSFVCMTSKYSLTSPCLTVTTSASVSSNQSQNSSASFNHPSATTAMGPATSPVHHLSRPASVSALPPAPPVQCTNPASPPLYCSTTSPVPHTCQLIQSGGQSACNGSAGIRPTLTSFSSHPICPAAAPHPPAESLYGGGWCSDVSRYAALPRQREEVCVHVSSPELKFNCAHFVAFKGFRERLHGHNYTVAMKIGGQIGQDGYVMDFGDMKTTIKRVCQVHLHAWSGDYIVDACLYEDIYVYITVS
eukprot:GHVQ01024142.1.p1 GENE.GHVQ01024142.1~~GHVQ01024142.1.p1  ORF type:complete len:1056 (-),score=267.94 GHVQ01024142.1:1-3168(-)